MGPKIEPCGTPLYTVSKELQIFFTFTHCFLPDKLLFNKFIDFSDRPYASSFNKMRSCGRQSKAFDKSLTFAVLCSESYDFFVKCCCCELDTPVTIRGNM